jgi:hypothetical protein
MINSICVTRIHIYASVVNFNPKATELAIYRIINKIKYNIVMKENLMYVNCKGLLKLNVNNNLNVYLL